MRWKHRYTLFALATISLLVVVVAHAIDQAGVLDSESPFSFFSWNEIKRAFTTNRGLVREDEQTPILLSAPTLQDWVPDPAVPKPRAFRKGKAYAQSYHYKGYIYQRPHSSARVLGVIRPTISVLTASRTTGDGCKNGAWYRVEPFGYACTRDGFKVTRNPERKDRFFPRPDVSKPLPYQYAEVTTKSAPRFSEIPSAQTVATALGAIENDEKLPNEVFDIMDGIYFVAIAERVQDGEQEFFRTVRGHYVRSDDVKVYPTYPMRGVKLGGKWRLPLAFVYDEDRPVYMDIDGVLRKVGIAEKHARFPVNGFLEHEGKRYVRGPGEIFALRKSVRMVRKTERPDEIPAGKRWVHINLSEQTLVAYEAGHPVYATLVSSGKEGYDTPQGLFRIRHKYLSVTMNGDDPIDGYYEVEEVPWTMYYWKSYAVHGAYWHNDFGKTRSHGCTNVPPIDARWLYYWTKPRVPENWHAIRRQRGTWVYFTSEKSVAS